MQELYTYQTYATREEAEATAERLMIENIRAEVAERGPRLDIIVGTEYTDPYLLRIPGADFEKANKILFADAQVTAADIDPAHPLFALSNDELRDVAAKPDEWGVDNYSVALALLKSRNAAIDTPTLQRMQQERMRTLATPKQGNRMLIFVGYVSCLLPLSLNALHFEQAHVYDNFPKMNFLYFPALWGLIIGWTFMWSFTTLPDGRRIAAYDEHARQQGRIILTINLLAWATSLLLFVGGNLQA